MKDSLKDVEKASLFGVEPNTTAQSHKPNCDWHNSLCDRGAQQIVKQQPRINLLLFNLQVKKYDKTEKRLFPVWLTKRAPSVSIKSISQNRTEY